MNPQPKPKTNRDEKYLEWLKTQPCLGCRQPKTPDFDITYAHKGGGMALKGPDNEALPLCTGVNGCHEVEHQGTATFWFRVARISGKTREQHVKEHQERWSKSNAKLSRD